MTQEAFKAWWYNEGSQAPYTHHDCEEHTMRMCEIAWANGAYKALTEHAMRETQRLGQEIEQKPVGMVKDLFTYTAWEKLDVRGSTKVYLDTQPQRTWVGLTDEDRNDCLVEADPCECLATPEAQELMRCVEAKSRSKNQ